MTWKFNVYHKKNIPNSLFKAIKAQSRRLFNYSIYQLFKIFRFPRMFLNGLSHSEKDSGSITCYRWSHIKNEKNLHQWASRVDPTSTLSKISWTIFPKFNLSSIKNQSPVWLSKSGGLQKQNALFLAPPDSIVFFSVRW